MSNKTQYEVVVGNVGTVLTTTSSIIAQHWFDRYVAISKTESGRASGEPVTILRNGEVYREYAGTLVED